MKNNLLTSLRLKKNLSFSVASCLAVAIPFALQTTMPLQAQKTFASVAKLKPSMRPTAADSARHIADLHTAIERVLADKKIGAAKYGIVVHSLDADKRYYQKNQDLLLTPASTTKLLSTFAAFDKFGGNYKARTSVYSSGKMRKNTLVGDIYLVGSGDPLLTHEDLTQLAGQLLALGIDTITGNVYADASAFDAVTDRKAYSGDADEVQPLPPITALTLNRNSVAITVSAGKKAGSAVRVSSYPQSDAISIALNARVARRGSLSVTPLKSSSDKKAFSVKGSIPPGQSRTFYFSVQEPDVLAAGVLRHSLRSLGVTVKGSVARAEKPHNASMLSEIYRPLSDIIAIVNKNSDNFVAEHVFKMIGGIGAGAKENTAKESVKLIRATLDNNSVPCQSCAVNDGSGLSRRNLVTPRALLRLLMAADNKPYRETFYETFSVAGIDGTLRKRMRGTPAASNLVGKTGTLRNVSALAGYVTTKDGERLAFSIIFNGANVGYYKHIEDKIGALLAGFSFYGA